MSQNKPTNKHKIVNIIKTHFSQALAEVLEVFFPVEYTPEEPMVVKRKETKKVTISLPKRV